VKKTIILFLISILLLAGLIYFSGPEEILNSLCKANLTFILIGIFLWFLGSVTRTLRWNILLSKSGTNVGFMETWKIFVASMFISNLSPAKSGDLIRPLILKRADKKSYSKTLPSVIMERILDLIVLIIIAIVSIGVLTLNVKNLSSWVTISIGFYVVAIIFGLFIVSSERRTERFFIKVFKVFSFIPKVKKYEKKVKSSSKKFQRSFKAYKNVRTFVIPAILSFFVWLIEGLIIYVSFRSIGLSMGLIPCIAVMPISILVGILTFLPGSLGSSEVITVTFFTTLFSVTLPQITTVTIIARLLSFWIYVILGAILFSIKFK